METRKHNRLSVAPKLTFEVLHQRGGDLALSVTNHGFGPAGILDFNIFVDTKDIPSLSTGGWRNALLALGLAEPWVHYYYFAPGDAFRPDQQKSLLFVRADDSSEIRRAQFLEALGRLNIVIDYKSIYGDSFRAEAKSALP